MKSWIGDRTKLDTSLFRNGVEEWLGQAATMITEGHT